MKKVRSFIYNRKKTVAAFAIAIMGGFFVSSDYNKYFEIAKNLEIFANLYKEINTYYVDDVDPAKLMRTGVDAMLESLDPFTNYISEAEISGFRLQITGKYGGIGASIRNVGERVIITEPYEDFPAHKAGLLAGDEILMINGKSAIGKTTKEVSNVLKGGAGDEVELTIKRPGEDKKMNFKVTREEIRIPNVPYFGMADEKTAYINLTTFTENAGKNVANALKELKNENEVEQVILDLRGNGGGLLREAINLCNVFIPEGQNIVTTKGKIKDWDKNYKTLNKPVDLDIPLAILINKSSASASEIVSGVLQDLDRGVVIGQKSYGKGLVQNTRDVGYNSKVKLTTAKYYIASGRCIQSVQYKDGEPVEISDSLKTPFKTKSGRTVYDGGGIDPDVKVGNDKLGLITQTLLAKNHIFDYATEYRLKHPTIAEPQDYNFTDADYADFKRFLAGRSYDYETQSEKQLEKLVEKAKKEKYYSAMETSINEMKQRIKNEKTRDLDTYKKEITYFLEQEIVTRYYFAKGRIQSTMDTDPEIKEALRILANPTEYKKILGK